MDKYNIDILIHPINQRYNHGTIIMIEDIKRRETLLNVYKNMHICESLILCYSSNLITKVSLANLYPNFS